MHSSQFKMRQLLSIRKGDVFIITILVIISLHTVTPQIIDCARLMMKVAKGILRVYAQCSKDFMESLNDNNREFQRRIDCVMKCVMGRVGLLDDVQKVTNDTMQVFFDQFIPEDFHEIGHIMTEGCIEEYAPSMENEIEDTCLPYGEFVKCVQGIIADAC